MKTTRRNLLKVVAAGGASAAVGLPIKTKIEAHPRSQNRDDDKESHGHRHKDKAGSLATATVSFGAWSTDPAVDRLLVPNPGARNLHELTPSEVRIEAGGTVNFIIAGFHQVVVYDDGIRPEDINAASSLASPLSALIDDPNGRIYRGLSPAGVPANFSAPGVPAAAIPAPPQERVEVVSFPKPGRFLVICGVRNHFLDPVTGAFVMFGYVKVLA